MSNYTKTTDFEAKDSLPTGDSGKIIRGAEFETEFDAISTAIATKADTAGPTFTGTLTFETISDGTIGVTAFVDEDDMSSDSATLVPTQQSVKAYVDSQVTAQDLDFQADSGGALSIDLDSETMTFTGGTGITTAGSGNDVEFAIDSTVATLTGSQTLISKTLTSPVLNGSVTGTAVLDEDNMASNSATKLATQQSIKAYVDTTVAATNELVEDSSPQLGGTLDLNGNNITGTGNINNTGTVTTDGLTVEGSSGSTLNNVNFLNTSTAYAATANRLGLGTTNSVGANYTYIEANNDVADGRPSLNFYTGDTATKRLRITDGGDVEFYEDGGSTAKLTWDASDEDLKFADNAKAVFGAGSDLQIYHDSSNSYIDEVGTGNLLINADNIRLRDTSGNPYFLGNSGAETRLYYAGGTKLATTSTGIDVTGTVTADGLTVDATTATIQDDSANLRFENSAGTRTGYIQNRADAFEIWNDQATFMAFGTNNTERMRIDSSGNVGIGTSSIAVGTKLQVAGETRIYPDSGTGVLRFGSGGVEKGKLSVDTSSNMAFETGGSERMRIDSSGNVGIGTDSPTESLHISTGSDTDQGEISLKLGANADSARSMAIIKDTSAPYNTTISSNLNASTAAGSLVFENGPDEHMRIDSAGNVGIGTSTPDTLLELVGDDPILTIRDSATGSATANATLRLAETGASDTLDAYWDIKAVGGDLQFIDNWNEGGGTGTRLVIDDSGNVGIGTASPSEKLTVAGNIQIEDNDGYLQFKDNNGGTNNKFRRIYNSAQDLFISRRNDDGTLEANDLVIDSDGNVGIGADSPASLVTGGSSPVLSIGGTDSGLVTGEKAGALSFITNDGSYTGTYSDGITGEVVSVSESAVGGAYGLAFYTGTTTGSNRGERLRINSAGNVGIGEDNPVEELHISGSVPKIQIQDSDGTNQYGQFYHSSGITAIQARNGNTDGIIAFQRYDGTTTDESARIDSSGNLLVNKTGQSFATEGVELKPDGQVWSTKDGGTALSLNRLTSDGSIAAFYKDGSTVGSIGTALGNAYYAGTATGVTFGSATMFPTDSVGSKTNGALDLGSSAARFKDLYLSGGAYLGGVAAANKLDDYEEGTWTPTLTGSTTAPSTTQQGTGKYTKVGNLVIVEAKLSNKDVTGVSGNWVVTGLPFTSDGNAQGTAWSGRVGSSTDMKMAYINSSNEIILVDGGGNALTWATAGTGTYAAVTIAFMVA